MGWWVGDATLFPTSFQPASSPGPGGWRSDTGPLKREGGAPGVPSPEDGLEVLLQDVCSVPGPQAWLCPEMGPRVGGRGGGARMNKENRAIFQRSVDFLVNLETL